MKLHFQESGSGPPLILLHGLLGSHQNLLPLAKRLAAHFRVFAVDQRNHGASPHADEMNYEVLAGDLREFLRQQNLPRAVVLGHSLGGKTAMQFALAHPDAVDKLAVVDMAPRAYPPAHEELLDALLALELETLRRRDEIDAALAPAVPDKTLRQFLLKNLGRDTAGAFHWKPNLRAIRENYPRLNAALPTDQKFAGPTLFVRGGKSDYVSDADFVAARRLFPRAELRTIAGAGHWVHADAPDEFARTVLEFLTAT